MYYVPIVDKSGRVLLTVLRTVEEIKNDEHDNMIFAPFFLPFFLG